MGDIEKKLYYDVLEDELREVIESVLKDRSSEKMRNEFQLTCYCSFEQYRSLNTGADIFHIAIMKESGCSDDEIENWKSAELNRRNKKIY